METFEKYKQTEQFLESLRNLPQNDYLSNNKKQNIWLKRFGFLLNLLGNPQKDFKYIHIGGTSGKGSLATMMHSILTEAGHTTGLYTSPFITTSIEKFKVNDELISPKDFVKLIENIKPAIDKTYLKSNYGCPTYFEICTALAFLYFKQKKCEYAILEVGCGGRFDATNIIPRSCITIINIIDFDHVDFLGNSLTKIAQEKAAIIKRGSIFFTTSKNNRNILKILEDKCNKKRAEFNLVYPPKKKHRLSLLGEHQQNNAELAMAACRKLGIPEPKIRTGLKKTEVPCRMEIIKKSPLVILDGAHNASKIASTAKSAKDLTYRKLYLIIAVIDNKDLSFLKQLIPMADKIFVTRHENIHKRCHSPKNIIKLIKKINHKKNCKIYLCPYKALDECLKTADKNDLILVTGSFYLAGELRKRWRPEEKILKERKI